MGISHLLQSGYQARKKNSVIEGEGQAHPTSKEFGKRVPETATTELTQLDPEPQATTQPATVCLGMFKYLVGVKPQDQIAQPARIRSFLRRFCATVQPKAGSPGERGAACTFIGQLNDLWSTLATSIQRVSFTLFVHAPCLWL